MILPPLVFSGLTHDPKVYGLNPTSVIRREIKMATKAIEAFLIAEAHLSGAPEQSCTSRVGSSSHPQTLD